MKRYFFHFKKPFDSKYLETLQISSDNISFSVVDYFRMAHSFLIFDLYFNPNLCHVCKLSIAGIKKCTGCFMISYCSREHQKLHWPSHKALCLCLQGIKKELGNFYYSQFNFSREKLEKSPAGNDNPIANKCPSVQELNGTMENNTFKLRSPTCKKGLTESVSKQTIGSESLPQTKSNDVSKHLKILATERENIESETIGLENETWEILLRKEWVQYKYKLLNITEKLLDRPLRNVEKEIVLNPKCCFVCKQNNLDLITCEACYSVNHCNDHILDETHSAHCKQFKLLLNINKYLVDTYLPNSFSFIEKISNFLEPHQYDNDLEYHELSEYTSYYRTLVHLIEFLNFSKSSLTFHVIGASEYECSPYSVYLWENVFHRLNFIKNMKILFVGFQVSSDQFKMKLCSNCIETGKEIRIECHQMCYDEYVTTCSSSAVLTKQLHSNKEINGVSIHADLLIAYNSGFHEFENNPHSNTWRSTLELLLKTKCLPVAFTAYTKGEIQRDTELIRSIAGDNVRVDFNIESEINAEASEKPRVDPEDGVYFVNKYISCFYCK